jgi:ribosome biogenesis GTPase
VRRGRGRRQFGRVILACPLERLALAGELRPFRNSRRRAVIMSFPVPRALEALGWTPFFHQQWLSLVSEQPDLSNLRVGRVCRVERGEYVLEGEQEHKRAVLSGRLEASMREADMPCIGDFVLALATPEGHISRVEHVFERASLFRRKAAGTTSHAQAIAANVDLGVVVSALPPATADPHAYRHGVSPRRIERYLCAIADAPARALVALNKADLHADADSLGLDLSRALGGVEVLVLSAHTGAGTHRLAEAIAASGSAVLVGSSGAGKSSLVNRLLGSELQRTAEVRSSDTRGRHTTTRRELYVLPSGGVLIDTPGMRELGLAANGDDAPTGFGEIEALSSACRFRDCRHRGEPGCAVQAAVARGELSEERLHNAHKLERELAFQRNREAVRERRAKRVHGRSAPATAVRGGHDEGE